MKIFTISPGLISMSWWLPNMCRIESINRQSFRLVLSSGWLFLLSALLLLPLPQFSLLNWFVHFSLFLTWSYQTLHCMSPKFSLPLRASLSWNIPIFCPKSSQVTWKSFSTSLLWWPVCPLGKISEALFRSWVQWQGSTYP